ncbi:MAG: serpin family protein [Candidatus Dormibacteria bacterium]
MHHPAPPSPRHGRSRTLRLALVVTAAALLAAACGAPAGRPSPSPTAPPTRSPAVTKPATAAATPQSTDLLAGITVTPADLTAAVDSDNALTVGLLQQLESSSSDGNFVDSAYSLATVLSMLELGAAGDTQTQMAAVLDSQGVSAAQQAAAWKQLDASLAATATADGISLDTANGIWLDSGLAANKTFLDTLVSDFSAPSSQVDFQGDPQGAANTINQWASSATKGMIPSVVSADQLQAMEMVLAGAVYFNADWQTQFDPGATGPGSFYPDSSNPDDQLTVPMMNGSGWTLPYYNRDGVAAVELPYVGGHYAADIVMPWEQSMSAFVGGLTPSALAGILQDLSPTQNVDLSMPRFDVSSQLSLGQTLETLGMPDAFSTAANFSGIASGAGLQLGFVQQNALIQVNEIGTTAAAVTVAGGEGGGGGGPEPPITVLDIDQPFLFLIRDTTTGAIVFAAQVADPTASS